MSNWEGKLTLWLDVCAFVCAAEAKVSSLPLVKGKVLVVDSAMTPGEGFQLYVSHSEGGKAHGERARRVVLNCVWL
jgi:hypothetical protein